MQNATEIKAASTASQSCCEGASGGSLNRRTLYIGLGIGAAAGLFLGWDWLVAIGAASLIIALAPCLIMCGAMCAMHKCMNKKSEVPATADPVNADAPITRTAADDAAVTDAAEPARAVANTPLPGAGAASIAAADVALANAALEPAPKAPASEARV